MDGQFYFPGVTLLITHYNRSNSLERLLAAFRQLNCHFDDIVVADDASKPEHLNKLKELQSIYNFRLSASPVNKGIHGNINKGQDAVKTAYTLYIQEDFAPTSVCPQHLLDALQIMNERSDIDYIRFWAFYRYPVLKPFAKGFSETIYSNWNLSQEKFYIYSDNPNLHRSSFPLKFGRFQEGIKGDVAEFNMSISYIKNKGKGLFYDEYSTLFTHDNSNDEPSTQYRANLKRKKDFLYLFARSMYLKLKWLKYTIYCLGKID